MSPISSVAIVCATRGCALSSSHSGSAHLAALASVQAGGRQPKAASARRRTDHRFDASIASTLSCIPAEDRRLTTPFRVPLRTLPALHDALFPAVWHRQTQWAACLADLESESLTGSCT